MLLHEFVTALNQNYPLLHSTLEVHDFTRFVALAAEVANRAKGLLSNEAQIITPFLRKALHLSLSKEMCYNLWHATYPLFTATHIQPGLLIQRHGYQPDLSVKIPEYYLVSPVKHCLTCPKPHKLHLRSRIDGYLYDVDGVHTIGIVTLKCPGCPTYYRPSYYSKNRVRTYYSSNLGRNQETYQVSCHFFMTHRLAELLREGTMLAHISNFNLANLFNRCYVDRLSLPSLDGAPTIQPDLSDITCRDALDIHCLLLKSDTAGTCLRVDVSDDSLPSEKRYHQAMQDVLEWIALEGSKHRNHACSACVRVLPLPSEDGKPKLGYIRAVVTDGLTIGHWRCTATQEQLRDLACEDGLPPPKGPCTSPLERVSDRFCPLHHQRLGKRCVAQPCKSDALDGQATCALQEHTEAYSKFKAHITSNFALTSMLNRPGSNRPSDPTVHQDWNTAELVGLDNIQQGDEMDRLHEQGREGADATPSRISLSRARTHNDQLIVATCGVILARETFYHSEGVSAVRDFLLRTFPRKLPQVCFYDNACKLVDHIYHGGSDSTRFLDTVIPVDPFHFHSHKESDEFCQYYTDPKLFPELRDAHGWYFNSSAGECSNVWYGGFASMARNMHRIRFNFMMEDMTERRNDWLIKRLSKRADLTFIGDILFKGSTLPLFTS
ncbi:uncharacterized protein MELLADRAFT_91869 [Melampsora larici-populina 98AG31]|uniref:CxC5 like cysteine cluster associated with KDZ domain-containing protein n=1 Tax=Melampsora larici-populina (strain 98AG31 / pathotype 3-4-7) TaxID=747676 RepID=F4S0N1_MELLP|nr:uncharacterized protein MELLADRAFT_91869 [Melampsora larici-populina 98AG31]EGG01794.1 hypothetical protein MELLADRAFT_91869 [Melampsora larici-populina 98AG31]